MRFKKLLGIFFFFTLVTTSVFGFTAENSSQGFDRNSTGLHQGFALSKAASAPGFLACFLDSSRQVFLLGQSGKSEGSFPSSKELAKRLGISENDFHRVAKKDIIKEFKDLLKNIKNPDIGFDKAGNILLRDPRTGQTLVTNTPLSWFVK
jgi:hypothetical protein